MAIAMRCVLIVLFSCFCLQTCLALDTLILNGVWSVQNAEYKPFPAVVPGGIYTDLMRNGLLPDVFSGYGDVDSRWVANSSWTYTKTFDVDVKFLSHNHQTLIFEGVDTFSTIYLNNKLIGTTDNMFLRYELSIDGLLKATNNELVITFESPIKKSQELYDIQAKNYVVPPKCVPGIYNGECHVNHIRKMQASFAWDWGPALPSMGLWKDVYIKAYNETYIKNMVFYYEQDDVNEQYNFVVTTYLAPNEAKQLNGVLRIELGNRHAIDLIDFDVQGDKQTGNEFVLNKTFVLPQYKFDLWWPNGHGKQVLYPLTVSMISENGETVAKSIKIGIRRVELTQNELSNHKLSFFFKIDGVAIFAKGSNMVPSHLLPEHSNNETMIRKLLQSAKDVHMNMIRVWGGGLYESDLLYEIADEMGIMIWQDFMFACSMYPVNSEFLSSVEKEVEHQVRRLQYHPSIVLWAGNNENEAALTGNWYGTSSNRTRYDADYRTLVKAIRDVVLKNDPSRQYLSSSPTNGLKSVEDDYISPHPGDNQYGDVHYYNYLFDSWDMNIYPTPRFASEYGYQAFPSYESMKTITNDSSDLYIDSKFMFHRQHHPLGNSEMQLLMKQRLDVPTKTNNESYRKMFLYYTQIIQAMAVKIETEHYRQWQSYIDSNGNGLTMGALYWQLNCPWLAPTWSGIESTGKWKMLHYFAKEFFAPLIVTAHQHSTQLTDIYFVNDGGLVTNLNFTMTIFNWNSLNPVNERVETIPAIVSGSKRHIKSNLKFFLKRNAACAADYSDCFVRLSLSRYGRLLSPDNYIYPVPLKNVNIPFANVQIDHVQKMTTKKLVVKVTTDLPAAFVWLESSYPGVFSENGFTMTQSQKNVVFDCEVSVTTDAFLQSLTVTHLRDKEYFPSKRRYSLYMP